MKTVKMKIPHQSEDMDVVKFVNNLQHMIKNTNGEPKKVVSIKVKKNLVIVHCQATTKKDAKAFVKSVNSENKNSKITAKIVD